MLPPLLTNIEQIEDIFLGTCPTTSRVSSVVFLIATACRSCEFPVSHSQSSYLSLILSKDYPIQIGSHGSLKPLNLYKRVSCHFTLSSLTIKLADILQFTKFYFTKDGLAGNPPNFPTLHTVMVFTQIQYIYLTSSQLYKINYVIVKIVSPRFHTSQQDPSGIVYCTGNIRVLSIVNTSYATIAGIQLDFTDVQAHNFYNTNSQLAIV